MVVGWLLPRATVGFHRPRRLFVQFRQLTEQLVRTAQGKYAARNFRFRFGSFNFAQPGRCSRLEDEDGPENLECVVSTSVSFH